MSAEHFQTFLSADMRTKPDGRTVEYAESGQGAGKRWADSWGPNADPEARGGWASCYLYAHTTMSDILAPVVETDVMTGLTGDHPQKRQQAADIIRATAKLVRGLALDDAFDGSMTDEYWAELLVGVRDAATSTTDRTPA